ncbi:hypothetical protein GCM10010910_29340 [Microbacterium nanhaiense]|uniref:GGDEF domain-containing protein n=1 Tax=Microbacterium nanhaiense TaxID=1301026 RepID=A0ABQ2N8Z5_9MICO|nr:hypothetical protein [Microbacterium nanhaiense]GGO67477.1 hypothetical protein GCM10010910_29340 [Microbacterium nanhaiense]
MMVLDTSTVSTMTSLVVVTAGIVFVFETLLREDHSVSRIWSLGFITGIISSVSYTIWAMDTSAWWAVAIGNASFVASAGFMWLGCRRFNDKPLRISGGVVAFLIVTTLVATLVAGEDGGPWAGAPVMYAGLTILPGAAAFETVTGALVRIRISVALTVVFVAEAAFYGTRAAVLLVVGEDSTAFLTWWGTLPASVLTIVLTVVAVVVTSMLRAERTGLRGRRAVTAPRMLDNALDTPSFLRLLDRSLQRMREQTTNDDRMAVISVRLEMLNAIAIAFGGREASKLRTSVRSAARLAAPVQAWVGIDGEDALLIATTVRTSDQANALASRIGTSISTSLQETGVTLAPEVRLGVAISDGDTDAMGLASSARQARPEIGASDGAGSHSPDGPPMFRP